MVKKYFVLDVELDECVLMILEHNDENLIKDITRVLDNGMVVSEFKTEEDAYNYIVGVRYIRSNPNLSREEIKKIEEEYNL